MLICCDQNVASTYVRAFARADGITVIRVGDVRTHDAPDDEIVDVAARTEWVIFTSDSDFFGHERTFGLLVYSQLEDPRPGDVVEAVRAIDRAYERSCEITETVPGGWV